MTAFRLNLGDRLLGERRGRDFHLVADLAATKNLFNTENCCIEDNSVAFFLCSSKNRPFWSVVLAALGYPT